MSHSTITCFVALVAAVSAAASPAETATAPSGVSVLGKLGVPLEEALSEALFAIGAFGFILVVSSVYNRASQKGTQRNPREKRAPRLLGQAEKPLRLPASLSKEQSALFPTRGEKACAAVVKRDLARQQAVAPEAAAPEAGAAAASRPKANGALTAETDILASAVRTGKEKHLTRLFDTGYSRACGTVKDKTPEEVATLLLLSTLRACAARQRFADALSVHDHASSRLGKANAAVWSLMLYCAVQAGSFSRCLEFWKRLCALEAPSGNDFVNIVRYFAHMQDKVGLKEMLSQMYKQGHSTDTLCRNRALAACTGLGAFELVDVLVADPICAPLDTVAYNTLMKGYAHAGFLKQCFGCYERMVKDRLPATEMTFGILLDACTQHGEFERARIVFKDLVSSGLPVNVVHFTTFIKGLVGSGHIEEASGVLRDMCSSRDVKCKPDIVTFSTLMKAHCDRGDMVGALKLLDLMVDQDVQPDAPVLNTVLNGCCVRPMEEDAVLGVLKHLISKGLRPSASTLSILRKALTSSGAWDRAIQALDEARDAPRAARPPRGPAF